MWFVALVACQHEEAAAPLPAEAVTPSPAAPTGYAPSADEAAMIRLLSTKDSPPACGDVEALSPSPVSALQHIVVGVSRPPTVAMRAADCLIVGHGAEVPAVLQQWVVDPNTRGLALLVLDRLDRVPAPVALEVAKAALSGPHAGLASPRIARSAYPEVKALAGGAP
jgi:hypothetical protein